MTNDPRVQDLSLHRSPAPLIPAMGERAIIPRLAEVVRQKPNAMAFEFPAHGHKQTYSELWSEIGRVAAGLRGLGLNRHDAVAIMLPNCPEYPVISLACDYAGFISINSDPGTRGATLMHMLSLAPAVAVVCTPDVVESAIETLNDIASIRYVICVDPPKNSAAIAFDHLDGPVQPETSLDPRETNTIRFTSGTTGLPKAVGFSQSQSAVAGAHYVWLGGHNADARVFTPFPLFHGLAGMMGVEAMVRLGATAIVDDRFHASTYWRTISESGATGAHMMTSLLKTLVVQPPSHYDTEHQCRVIQWCQSDPAFSERFGVAMVNAYASSEVGVLAYTTPGEHVPPGSVGRVGPLYDARIFDENDEEVSAGTRGEIVVRSQRSHIMMTGYIGRDSETVRAWRNLWYHTGDEGHVDSEGHLFIHGRMGDQIRRKGVNVSAAAVEQAALEHPRIKSAALIGIPSELGESELKLCVVYEEEPDPIALFEFLTMRLSREMLPRYVEYFDDLPRTNTGKVQKRALREQGDRGITESMVDLQRFGTTMQRGKEAE